MTTRVEQVKVTADVNNFTSKMAVAGQSAKQFARDLDSADSRMAFLVQSSLALGPALVPIGAAAIPAIAGIAEGLTLAVGAAGVAVLAFQGVGDALDAVNNYQLDPTDARLQKLRETMSTLGPAGQDFVLFLQDLRPGLQELQDTAQAGLFPGLAQSIDELLVLGPQANQVIDTIARTLGDLAVEGADNLNDQAFVDFFNYIDTEARPILTAMGRTLGNFAEGFANLLMAVDPLSNQFSDGFLGMSRDFKQWSDELDSNKSFQAFLEYVQRVTPKAAETLGALVQAVADLVAAAAPVGEVTLPAITAIANAISAVADSHAGPILIATAAGLSAISRAIALFRITNGSALVGTMRELNTVSAASIRDLPAASKAFFDFGTPLDTLDKKAKGSLSSTTRLKQGLGSLGKAGAGMAGLTLLATDMGDSFSGANALALGLTGTMAGPWGAAVGVAIGSVIDFAHANDELESSIKAVDDAAKKTPFDFKSRTDALDGLRQQAQATSDDLHSVGLGDFTLSGIAKNIESGFTDPVGEASDKARQFAVDTLALQQGIVQFSQAVNNQRGLTGFTTDLGEIQAKADVIVPALQAAGYSIAEIQNILLTGNGFDKAVGDVKAYLGAQDSVPGRSAAVGAAIAGVGTELSTAADKADALKTALDDLFGPELGLSEATDQWTTALRHLNDDLAKHHKTLVGDTDAAIKNRAAVRGRVDDFSAIITAEARAGASGKELAADILDQRQAFIKAGVAAGLHRDELVSLLHQFNLTPKLVQTVFKALGITKAEQDARDLRDRYNDLPKDVRTDIAANGISASATVASLMRKYDGLSRADATTIIEARDHATSTINSVRVNLSQLDGNKATVFIDTIHRAFDKIIPFGTKSADGDLFDYYANGDIRTTIGSQQPQIQPNHGPRGITWAETGAGPWEAFISGHPAKRDRSRSIADETVARLGGMVQWFANGGLAENRTLADGGLVGRDLSADRLINMLIRGQVAATLDSVADALHRMRAEAADVEKAEDQLREAREASKLAARAVRGNEKDLEDARKDSTKSGDKLESVESKIHDLRKADKPVSDALAQQQRELSRQHERDIALVKSLTHSEKERGKAQKDADKALQKAEDELSKQRDQLAKATQAWKAEQDQLIQAAQAVSDAITAQGAAFGGDGTSVTAGGFLTKVTGAADSAEAFDKDVRQLRRRHVDQGIIDQVLAQGSTAAGVALADSLAHARQGLLNNLNKQEQRLERDAARTGAFSVSDERRRHRDDIRDVNIDIGPVTTTDVDRLAKLLPGNVRRALRIARRR